MENYSVLMSVYKKVKADELRLSIKSMMEQTIPPQQFVIVWDGPAGKELQDVVEDYKKQYINMFTIVNIKENRGLAYALNEGIKACRNSLIARMDSDDFSLPERCEKQLKEFERDKNLSLLGGHTRHFRYSPDNPLNVYGRHPVSEEDIKKYIRRNSAFSHPTVMFRKNDVIACGCYDRNLRRSQDHDLFTRMIAMGYKCCNLDEVLVLFRADENCMLRNKNKESCKARIIIQKRLLKRKQCTFRDYLYVRSLVLGMQMVPKKLYLKIYSLLKEKK